jgi:hypothetical protein
MVNHARTSELMTLQLELPFEVPEHARIDPWRMSDLTYDLAVVFGVISLDNMGITVFGEWGGKSSTDYLSEHVKVQFQDEEACRTVAKQAGICRKILGNAMA